MYNKIYNINPFESLRRKLGLSELGIAKLAGLSRLTWRKVARGHHNATLDSLAAIASALERDCFFVLVTGKTDSQFSTVGTAYKVMRDGEASWKIHFMNLIDEFRLTLDSSLVLLPPPTEFPPRLTAFLASIVLELCRESQVDAPAWAQKKYTLSEPWFVAGSDALKASALKESPLAFRRNNIFVLDNFMARA